MSTILKALKKLEEEQRAGAPVSLADKVLSVPGTPRRSAGKPPWVAAGVLGGLLVAGLTVAGVFWLSSAPRPLPEPAEQPAAVVRFPPGTQQPGVVAAPAPPAVKVTAPVATSPPPSAAKLKAPVKAPAGRAVVTSPQPATAAKAAPQSPPPSAAASTADSLAPRVEPAAAAPARLEQTLVTPGQIPPAGRQWTAPQLEVSDILGGTGSGSRMAVVNGLPVMEGTRVDNALVKEIRDGQVLFEIDGRSVVVPQRAAR